MAYLETFLAALRTRISTVWPEVTADGIWEGEHAAEIPWPNLTPPYAVIVLSLAASDDWGGSNKAYVTDPLEIYYVADTGGGGGAGLRAKLEALRDDLLANELTSGQVMDVPNLSTRRTLFANQVFFQRDLTFRAGMIGVDAVVGETF